MPELKWLALEAKYLDRARGFYEEKLELEPRDISDSEVKYRVGDTDLILREPGVIPRGGVHTHYAFSTPRDRYNEWKHKLSQEYELVEHEFGDSSSLYVYDPDNNCVEIGQRGGDAASLTGIFEVVIEVEDLEKTVELYRNLGGELYTGGESDRERLDMDGFDLEIWLPRLGIADGQGALHIDMGLDVENPDKIIANIDDLIDSYIEIENGYRFRDKDGHHVTII